MADCPRSALPNPLLRLPTDAIRLPRFGKLDLNQRPASYKGAALTVLSYSRILPGDILSPSPSLGAFSGLCRMSKPSHSTAYMKLFATSSIVGVQESNLIRQSPIIAAPVFAACSLVNHSAVD